MTSSKRSSMTKVVLATALAAGLTGIGKACTNARHARWSRVNPLKVAERGANWRERVRDDVPAHYSGCERPCCTRCNDESHPEFLVIDHD